MSYLKDKNDQMSKNLVNISSINFARIVGNLKTALKEDKEIINILNGINTSYCNRTDFIERIQKIDDISKLYMDPVANKEKIEEIEKAIGGGA
jgi:hypothetical protein